MSANHPAIAQAASIASQAPRLLDDGSIDRPTHDAWLAAAVTLEWLGRNADTFRVVARAVTAATRRGTPLTSDEIAALTTRPEVAAVMTTFPDAQIIDGGPLTRPAYTPSAEEVDA